MPSVSCCRSTVAVGSKLRMTMGPRTLLARKYSTWHHDTAACWNLASSPNHIAVPGSTPEASILQARGLGTHHDRDTAVTDGLIQPEPISCWSCFRLVLQGEASKPHRTLFCSLGSMLLDRVAQGVERGAPRVIAGSASLDLCLAWAPAWTSASAAAAPAARAAATADWTGCVSLAAANGEGLDASACAACMLFNNAADAIEQSLERKARLDVKIGHHCKCIPHCCYQNCPGDAHSQQ